MSRAGGVTDNAISQVSPLSVVLQFALQKRGGRDLHPGHPQAHISAPAGYPGIEIACAGVGHGELISSDKSLPPGLTWTTCRRVSRHAILREINLRHPILSDIPRRPLVMPEAWPRPHTPGVAGGACSENPRQRDQRRLGVAVGRCGARWDSTWPGLAHVPSPLNQAETLLPIPDESQSLTLDLTCPHQGTRAKSNRSPSSPSSAGWMPTTSDPPASGR